MEYFTILYAVFAALGYALLFYAKAYQGGEQFSQTKFLATLLVGAGIGVLAVVTGSPITKEGAEAQLLTLASVIVLLDNILKLIWRKLYPEPTPP
ncbi:MAG: hypothetical protein Q8O76_14085 [Chloroflexota bacterium]|nr:hypothetical protein [Chloroflexota bacterium]